MRDHDWVRVTKGYPCPCCERPDWCAVAGDVVKCMRVQSEREVQHTDGTIGWLHRLSEEVPPPPKPRKKAKPVGDVSALASSMFKHSEAKRVRLDLADHLGVEEWALEDLRVGVGWDRWSDQPVEYSSFPSRDGRGTPIGIIRRYSDGKKLTYPGTRNSGVFVAEQWWIHPGPIFIPEGGSDVAALLSEGFPAIGRPSCCGGLDPVVSMIQRRAYDRDVIIIGEQDCCPDKRGKHECCPQNCEGCQHCWPGHYGAVRLKEMMQRRLRRHVRVMFPPIEYKDVRSYIQGDPLGFRRHVKYDEEKEGQQCQ